MRRPWVLAATLVLLAAGQVGAACWNTDAGGWLLLEVGESRGWVIPVMGTYLPSAGPACLGHRSYPTHGIAQLIGDQVLLGLTISAEGEPGCGTMLGEFVLDVSTLSGTGVVRSAPHFDQPLSVSLSFSDVCPAVVPPPPPPPPLPPSRIVPPR
jgi:hypothetical protein